MTASKWGGACGNPINNKGLLWKQRAGNRNHSEAEGPIMGPVFDTYFILVINIIFTFFSLHPLISSFPFSCKLWKKFNLNEMRKPGDVVLGGLFEVHYSSVFPERTYTSEPQLPVCRG